MRSTTEIEEFLAAAKACDDSPVAVRTAREAAGLSQADAARAVDLSSRARWHAYENAKATGVARRPGFATWQLFLLLTGQHPTHKLVRR